MKPQRYPAAVVSLVILTRALANSAAWSAKIAKTFGGSLYTVNAQVHRAQAIAYTNAAKAAGNELNLARYRLAQARAERRRNEAQARAPRDRLDSEACGYHSAGDIG